jgi:formylglycine-generating enzyme required for sulfatase activity
MREPIEILVRKRLLRTEGQGEQSTVSISHEKLFEAWPSLKDFVAKNKKQLVDRTLLESRARTWVEQDRPWFSGLASRRDSRAYSRSGVTPTHEMKDYLSASRRAHWLFNGAVAVVLLVVAMTTWLWQKGYSVDQAGLKLQSFVVSIHVVPEMQTVSGGTFRQGNIHGRGGPEEQPVHEVTIKSFALGKFEVTFEEYDRYAIAMGRSLPVDQGWGRGRQPVIYVSWQDAKDYADWLSQQTGKRYRLPTESEWEYAARSGGTDQTWAGTSDEQKLGDYAVYLTDRTAPVGTKKSNDLGLYDMSGNVWEWVEDCWHGEYKGAPTDGSAWLEAGGGDCGKRVIRGGSWYNFPVYLRTSNRYWNLAGDRLSFLGFRLVQDIAE